MSKDFTPIMQVPLNLQKLLWHHKVLSLIYRGQMPLYLLKNCKPSALWGSTNPSLSPYSVQRLFSAIPHRSWSGQNQVKDLQKLCSSEAVICGKDDIRQKANVLYLHRCLRTDRLVLLLSFEEEVLNHPCSPCWFDPTLLEKGGSLCQKSHPE